MSRLSRPRAFAFTAGLATLLACANLLAAQAPPPAPVVAPAAADLDRVWHLGRVTGDLERIIAFYHDLVGLGLRGARNQPRPFAGNATINEFVNAPAEAEYRAAFLPIPGASAATDPQNQVYLEAFEYRNVERHQHRPALSSPGVSSLKILVRDLTTVVTAAKAAGVAVVTAGGEPVPVPAPSGLTGSARAIMLRDPDGYPVELVEVAPTPRSLAPESGNVLGAHMSVVVTDAAASLAFYRRLAGSELQAWSSPWQAGKSISQLRGIPEAEFRTASVLLPGSTIVLELIEFRGIPPQPPYRPVFQDIGFGHVAFIAKDVGVVVDRIKELGLRTISQSGTWTQINPTTRAVYTRDRDGFFVEVLERR